MKENNENTDAKNETSTENEIKKSTFDSLNVSKNLIEKLKLKNITVPTSVQAKVIPLVAEGKNIMFQSETGTGKTFAYLLPLVQKLESEENPKHAVKVLIAAPTYELASQIKVQVQLITELKSALCIGSTPLTRQIELLKEKPVIIIGGPARLLELIHLKKLKADYVQTLVLDEADRLLSPELRDETECLLERLPQKVQLIGCSATVSDYTRKILQKARDGLVENQNENDAESNAILLVTMPENNVLANSITHWALFAERRDKIDTLRSFINAVKPKKLIVFTSRTDQIQNIVSKLQYKKINCAGLCAKTDKKERKAAIDRFRSGKCPILITTDLASRGLDIEGITHVVQMDLPEDADFFIHRSGRTARAGQKGINCVIGDEMEMRDYALLEKKLKIKVYPKELFNGKIVSPEEIEQNNQSGGKKE